MCVEATNVIIDQKCNRALKCNTKNILNNLKPSNATKSVLLERAPLSTKVGRQRCSFEKIKDFIFFRNGTAQLVTVAHKRRKTSKARGAIS